MKRILSICLFLGVFIFPISCKKEFKLPNQESQKIIGKWCWVKSTCGWSGESTPTSTGQNIDLSFDANGNYAKFINGKQDQKLKYTVSEKYYANTNSQELYITFRNGKIFNHKETGDGNYIRFSGNDSLFTGDGNADDGCASIYVRKY
ncbi:MAG: hypothetical protein K9I70_10755 [Chitinophagaceae bacterium]|jgi:hypothetical protein|nr:hypothetical protein [Chitinophagaceae bacterium]